MANCINMRKTLSSNSYTFQLHQPHTLKTDHAFKHDLFPYMHRYQQMASLFIHRMIKLWMPTPPLESHNFVADILIASNQVQFKLPTTRLPFSELAPEHIQKKIHQHRTQNLAAIAFFNYIFNVDFSKTKLYVSQSPTTKDWYFVQDNAIYLQDYFREVFCYKTDQITNQQLCANIPDNGEIQRCFFDTINLNDPWITSIFAPLSSEDIKWLCMQNLFEVLMRISLTPPALVHHFVNKYFNGIHKEDKTYFSKYFLSLILMIKNNIRHLCSPEEYQHWQYFIENHGHNVYLTYIQEIFQISQVNTEISPQQLKNILDGLHRKAFYLHIPNLLDDCKLPKIQTYSKSLYIGAMHYVLQEMQMNWTTIQYDAKHVFWEHLNQLIKYLPQPQCNIFKIKFPFLDTLFLIAIKFHHNQIVKFIFQQKNILKNQTHPYFDPENYSSKILKNASTLLIAIYYQNSVICQLLRENFVRLNQTDELKFLDLLMDACLSNNMASAQFYLQHYPNIFNHPTMQSEIHDTLAASSAEIRELFSQIQAQFQQNPTIIAHPHPRRRRHSFFSTISTSESSYELTKLAL